MRRAGGGIHMNLEKHTLPQPEKRYTIKRERSLV